MAYGKEAAQITAQTTFPKKDYILKRADRLGWSQSQFISEIINFWYAVGAPSLATPETFMPPIPVPIGAREELRPYWADTVVFNVKDGSSPKQQAARLLSRPHKEHTDAAGESNRSQSKRA